MASEQVTRNQALLQRGMDAFVHRDVATLQQVFHPAVVWHDQGRNRISGTFSGMGDVLAHLGTVFTLAGDSIRLEPIAALTDEGFVAAVIDVSVARGAKKVRDRSIFLARVADDKIAEVWAYAWDPYALDDFWGAPT